MSCKLSLKDNSLPLSHLPLPSKEYPTYQEILNKRRVEKAAGVYVPSPLERHPLYEHSRAQRRHQDSCASHITTGWNSGACSHCVLREETRDQAVEVTSWPCSSLQTGHFRIGDAEGWERASLVNHSSFPFILMYSEYPVHTLRLCHIRIGALSLTSLRHWFVPLQILVDLLPRFRS